MKRSNPSPRRAIARRLGTLALVAALAGCASVSKVNTGETLIKNRMTVHVDAAWNQFERGMGDSTPTWTTEGITVDALRFYVGVKDGELIAPTPSGGKGVQPLAFKSGMQPADVVALFQGLYTRDGSSFALVKLEPAEFVGQTGFRFEYTLTRKIDDVRLRGVAWAAVRGGELFMIDYSAPRLSFFDRQAKAVQTLVASARVKS